MSSKLKSSLIFVSGAVFSTWIGTFIANPLGDKIFNFLSSTPTKISHFILDCICSCIPYYECHNTNSLWSAVGLGISSGILALACIIFLELEFKLFSRKSNTRKLEGECSASLNRGRQFFRKKFFSILFACFLIFTFFFNFLVSIRYITAEGIAIDTVRKIEILAPYVNDLEYKKLKSEFYLIQTWDDYNQLNKQLDSIMEAEGISVINK